MKSVHLLFLLLISLSFRPAAQTLTVLSPEDFEKGLSKPEVQLLDVRTSGEYQNAHIKNSLQADWVNADQFKNRVQYLDKNKPVMIYCAVGGRSHAAAEWLRNNGYTDVQELKGGLTAWKSLNKPTDGLASVKQMTTKEYEDLIKTQSKVLVDFGAEWCPPCKKMEPILNQLQDDLKTTFKLVKIDGSIHTDVMKQLKVTELPVFIVYKNGKETWRKEGVADISELKAQLTN